jgi:hypothetical protein
MACGPDNGLTGSMSEVIDLAVSRAEVLRNEEALQVVYYRNRGVFLDIVARVTVYVKDLKVGSGERLELTGDWREGNPRTTVGHAPGGEPLRLFPTVRRGEMNIIEGGAAGGPTRGTFFLLFDATDGGGDLGYNRTLNGTFYAKETRDAGFGLLP